MQNEVRQFLTGTDPKSGRVVTREVDCPLAGPADGDVDAFVNIHGGRSRLLRNDGGSRSHWLRVRLRGPRGNPRGIGSTIRVVVGGTAQSRQVGASSSYLSQHATGEEVFGLGVASRVDTVEVSWLGGSTVRALGMGTRQTVIATPEAVVGELAR